MTVCLPGPFGTAGFMTVCLPGLFGTAFFSDCISSTAIWYSEFYEYDYWGCFDRLPGLFGTAGVMTICLPGLFGTSDFMTLTIMSSRAVWYCGFYDCVLLLWITFIWRCSSLSSKLTALLSQVILNERLAF